MATMEQRKNKTSKTVRTVIRGYVNRERFILNLGSKYSDRDIGVILAVVETVARNIETGGKPDRTTAAFLDDMSDDLRERFVKAGLIEQAETVTLGGLVDEYFRDVEKEMADNTIRNKTGVTNRLIEFFGGETPVEEITQDMAGDFRETMLENFADATVAGAIKTSHALFAWGLKKKRIFDNPFHGVKAGSMVNKSREHFVTREQYRKLLDACPDQDWRTLLALCRYGGLRNPSETLRLQWSDVNWEKGVMRVTSPKTEAYVGKDSRLVPLFPELWAELDKQRRQAKEGGSPYVITQWRDTEKNMRTHFQRIIFRAGLAEWPRLFHNLRGSRSCELFSEHPAYVAAEWMGQSEKVAQQHYLHATEADIERAIGRACFLSGGVVQGKLHT